MKLPEIGCDHFLSHSAMSPGYLYICDNVCKGWAVKLAPAPQPSMIYCAKPSPDILGVLLLL
jgi:hypothetical protein